MTRSRTCDNPAPANGGEDCSDGSTSYAKDACNEDKCPIDGGYSDWGEWSTCTAECGGGTRSRSRTCTNPEPQHGGADCSDGSTSSASEDCNKDECPDCGSVYDGSDSKSGCFTISAGKCILSNAACFKLTCSANKLEVSLRSDAFGNFDLKKDSSQKFKINDKACETQDVTYDKDSDMHKFDMSFGSCGMKTEMKDSRINFVQKITAEGMSGQQNADLAEKYGIAVEKMVTNSMIFTCSFEDSVSTDKESDAPKYVVNRGTKENAIAIEEQLSWSDFDLGFFKSAEFKTPIDGDINLGSQMYLQAKWTNEVKDDFPVKFYIQECTVKSGDNEFKIIDKGCGKDIIESERIGEQFSRSKVQYKYLSFSFDEGDESQNQSVVCQLKFCIVDKCPTITCD